MFTRIRNAIGTLFPRTAPRNAPLGSIRPLPESVKELARRRPAFPQARPASPWPLVNHEGKTWAQVRRERDAAAQVSR